MKTIALCALMAVGMASGAVATLGMMNLMQAGERFHIVNVRQVPPVVPVPVLVERR